MARKLPSKFEVTEDLEFGQTSDLPVREPKEETPKENSEREEIVVPVRVEEVKEEKETKVKEVFFYYTHKFSSDYNMEGDFCS